MRFPPRRPWPPPPSAPHPHRLPSGTLAGETIALVNPQKNYAQFLLRALLPMIIHVVITLAAGYSVGSEFRRRDARDWLESAGGDPVVALVGKLAPLFGIFFLIMLAEPLFLEGVLKIPFKGDLPLMVAAGSLLIIASFVARRLAAAPDRRPGVWARTCGPFCFSCIRLRRRRLSHGRHECLCASLERDSAAALVHGRLAGTSGAGIAGLGIRRSLRGARGPDGALCRPRIAAHGEPQAQGLV